MFVFIFSSEFIYAQTNEDLLKEEERLSEEDKEIYYQFKKDFKEIIKEEGTIKIREKPSQKQLITDQYNTFYNKTLIDLLRNLRRGKIKIVREWTSPGIFGSSPPGAVSRLGEIFAFFYYSPEKRRSKLNDSAVGVGAGFGNPDKYVGGNITLTADSIYKSRKKGKNLEVGRRPDFDLGGVNLRIGRKVPYINGAYFSVGQNKITSWGYNSDDINLLAATYLSYSHMIGFREPFKTFSSLQYTIGMGDKSFLPEEEYQVGAPGFEPFFGLGLRVLPQLSITLDRVSREIHFGTNIAPFSILPIVFRLSAVNVLSRNRLPVEYSLTATINHAF